jgi:protein QN1
MQTSRSQLGAGEEVPVIGKQVPCKKARSTPSLPKRKPQSGLYASARSSGYGKPSSPLQLFSALEKKTSKDNTKTKSVRSIPTSNQFRKRGKSIFLSRQNWIHRVHSLIFFGFVE